MVERFRRLLTVPTIRRLLPVHALAGAVVVSLPGLLPRFMTDHFALGRPVRAVILVLTAAGAVGGFVAGARRARAVAAGDDPGSLLAVAATALAAAGIGLAVTAVVPSVVVAVAGAVGATAALAVALPLLHRALLAPACAGARVPAGALAVAALGGAGGLLGVLLVGSIDRRFGSGGAVLVLAGPCVLAGAMARAASNQLPVDVEAAIGRTLDQQRTERVLAAGGHLPLLSCRGVDFSYGPMQVLFGVDFTVDDGEMVALLGVNGAGKSTLLRVICGLGLPSAGSVRLRGQDITHLDAERRLRMGVTQVPGGRAVFGPLTVADNLRGYGYSLGRDRRRLDAAIDECFEAFPRLAERRGQAAMTLSGGEQQMLALSKALILRPRVLLIDELSLGLAPLVVARLLEMVRRINAAGTAVVLVEQSVTVALGLVGHACFMEKGEIRFDGRSEDLLGRGDLLRAVFLDGAGAVSGLGQ